MEEKVGFTVEEQDAALLELYARKYHFDYEVARNNPEWLAAMQGFIYHTTMMVQAQDTILTQTWLILGLGRSHTDGAT